MVFRLPVTTWPAALYIDKESFQLHDRSISMYVKIRKMLIKIEYCISDELVILIKTKRGF